MLGSGLLAVRLGGIYALDRLARDHPGDYHTQIMRLFCAFVHHHPVVEKEEQDLEEQEPTESRLSEALGSRICQRSRAYTGHRIFLGDPQESTQGDIPSDEPQALAPLR